VFIGGKEMSQEIDELVSNLLGRGYGYLQVDAQYVANAKDAARLFIESLKHIHMGWGFKRPGERELDAGVISKDARDIKTFFHSSHDLPLLMGNKPLTPQQKECLKTLDACRRYLETLGKSIASHLGMEIGIPELSHLVDQTTKVSRPYNVSTLRVLSYPDVADQKGASAHYDRSFLTMHLGDSGGNLEVFNECREWESASPPQGSVLVFGGVKALELTSGRLTPCYHKSTTIRGKERTAAVMFIHADSGREVPDAQKEYDRFYGR
jgi:isopenicillin N synthase-like dioxygenase